MSSLKEVLFPCRRCPYSRKFYFLVGDVILKGIPLEGDVVRRTYGSFYSSYLFFSSNPVAICNPKSSSASNLNAYETSTSSISVLLHTGQ